jgi:hypothetical protein
MATDAEYFVPKEGRSNFCWAVSGNLLIQLALTGDVPPPRFEEYLKVLSTRDITHILSIARGSSSINSVQRKKGADIARDRNIKIAVVLDNAITRGLVTAFSWLGIPMKSYRPENLDEAIDYLAAPNINKAHVLEILAHLESVTAPVE